MPCFPSRRAARKRARLEAERAAAAESARKRAAADAAAANALPRPTPLPRPLSRVEAQASKYEALDAKAHVAPSLVDVKQAMVGTRSRKLLDGYEKREAEAREVPELVQVSKNDLKAGEGFLGILKNCEDLDRAAAAEPKLEKTFVQRERESVQRIVAMEEAARIQVNVPSIHG